MEVQVLVKRTVKGGESCLADCLSQQARAIKIYAYIRVYIKLEVATNASAPPRQFSHVELSIQVPGLGARELRYTRGDKGVGGAALVLFTVQLDHPTSDFEKHPPLFMAEFACSGSPYSPTLFLSLSLSSFTFLLALSTGAKGYAVVHRRFEKPLALRRERDYF